jgi:hypothetical protein
MEICHSERSEESDKYKTEILRLEPQNDITTQPLNPAIIPIGRFGLFS